MSHRKAWLSLMVVFSFCTVAFCAVERTDLLPSDCVLSVRVSNTTRFIEQFKKSSVSRLWSDPQMQEVFGKKGFVESMKEEMAKDKPEELAHLEWVEMLMLGGEVVVALMPEGDEPVIIAYMSEEDYKRSLDMDRRIAELKKDEELLTVTEGTFQGAPLVQLITEKTKDGEKVKTTTWQSHVKNTLISSENREFVEKTIVNISKNGIKEPVGLPVLSFKMRLEKIIEMLEKKVPPAAPAQANSGMPSMPPPPRPRQIFKALGMDTVDGLSADVTMKDDEMVLDSHIYGSDFTRGVFKLLVSKPTAPDFKVPFIPADAFSYEVTRMDLRAFWNEIPNALAALNPMYVMQYNIMLAAMVGSIGIDIDRELLANLDTQYISFSASEDGKPVSVSCIRLNNEAGLKGTLAKLFADTGNFRKSLGEMLRVEEFRGSTMYIFDQPEVQMPPETEEDEPVQEEPKAGVESKALTVGGGFLFYGEEPGVRMVLRSLDATAGKGEAFYASPLARELRRLVPSNSIGYSMVDWQAFIKTFLAEVNKDNPLTALKMLTGPGAMGMGGLAAGNKTGMFEDADYSKLPSAVHMSSFFGPSFSYNTRDIGGLHGKMIMRYSPLGNK